MTPSSTARPYARGGSAPERPASPPVPPALAAPGTRAPRPRRRGFLLAAVLLLAWLKLWSVAHDELVVRDLPSDDPWYLSSASAWYWGGQYELGALSRQPGYPVWIALARTFGVPLRLATEFLYLAAAALLALALASAGAPPLLAAVLFAAVAFHPFSFSVNAVPGADSLYAPVLILAVAAMAALLTRDRRPALALLTGLALAVLWHTRQETVLIPLYVAWLGACAWWVRATEADPPARAKRVAPLVLIPAAVVVTALLATRIANHRVFGTFAEYDFASQGFQAGYNALLRIEPDPPLPMIPVTGEVLRRAYAASPTFRLLRPYFEGPRGGHWRSFTAFAENPAVRGEISAGHFGWALADAVRRAAADGSAPGADALHRRFAGEIEAACNAGRLRCRPVPLGPVDPHVGNYLNRLPRSMLNVVVEMLEPHPRSDPRRARPPRAGLAALADDVTTRRSALVRDELHLVAWAAHPIDPVQYVSFRNPVGEVLAITDRLRPRPDLQRYFETSWPQHPQRPVPAAFHLTVPFSADGRPAGELVFHLRSGRRLGVTYDQVRTAPLGRLQRLRPATTPLEYAIEARAGPREAATARHRLQDFVHTVYGPAVALVVVAAIATLPLRLRWRRRDSTRVLEGIVVLLLGVAAARLGMLAVIDASAWSATSPRFLLPVAPLVSCAALLVLYLTVGAWRGFGARRP